MRRWRSITALAALLLITGSLFVPAAAADPAPIKWALPAAAAVKVDYSNKVDFTNTGLDRYSMADAALLSMTQPDRVKDPAERAAYAKQLADLIVAQHKAGADARAKGLSKAATRAKVLSVASPSAGRVKALADPSSTSAAAADTIDPGCQLTSSYPNALDLCAYDSRGDVMSRWGSGRTHQMWAGLQESDTQPCCGSTAWRGWWKSQAHGLSSDNVDHHVNVDDFTTWQNTETTNTIAVVGSLNPSGVGPCSPCYGIGSFHAWTATRSYGDSYFRTSVSIDTTNDASTTDNYYCSGFWYRYGGYSYWPGPLPFDCPIR